MPVLLKHAFASAVADNSADATAGKVLPSHWNAGHSLTMASASILGNPTGAASDASEITLSPAFKFVGAVLTPNQPPAATLTNNAVATTETIVARWALPAAYMVAGATLNLNFSGQVSSTATLAFRVRIGTAGTVADPVAGTFTTSAAGVANAHVTGGIQVYCLTSGTTGAATIGGTVSLAAAQIGLLTAAFASAAVNTTVAQFVSVTLVQSVAQTYTSRAAVLTKVI